jgi:hypothetical protein
MAKFARIVLLAVALGAAGVSLAQTAPAAAPAAAPAPHLLDRFKALEGTWSASGLDGNSAPDLRIRYETTAGGNAVVETLFIDTPHEMRTVFYKDGADLVLTHYCASGNHPRMRARPIEGDKIAFAFDGANNFDPASAGHMHDAQFEFVGPDELRARWISWKDGKPAEHAADMHVRRVGK